jgi:hypothetical protein
VPNGRSGRHRHRDATGADPTAPPTTRDPSPTTRDLRTGLAERHAPTTGRAAIGGAATELVVPFRLDATPAADRAEDNVRRETSVIAPVNGVNATIAAGTIGAGTIAGTTVAAESGVHAPGIVPLRHRSRRAIRE